MPHSKRMILACLVWMLSIATHQSAFGQFGGRPVSASTKNVQKSDSLVKLYQQTEQILSRVYPDLFLQPMKTSLVLRRLRRLGLPIVLDRSAIDDSLDLNITLELPLPDQPLGVRLRHALREQNSALTITDGLIRIVSLDDVDSDPQYLMTLVYDVTHLRSSPNALTELVQNSIDSEQWLDTGSGLGTISAIRIRQTNLLVVTQTYEVHRQMHALLGNIALASGARQSKLTVPKHPTTPTGQQVSQAITLPPVRPVAQGTTHVRIPQAVASPKNRVRSGGVF